MNNLEFIPTAGGMQAKFKSGLLMNFVKGEIDWYLDPKVWYDLTREEMIAKEEEFNMTEEEQEWEKIQLDEYNNSLK